MVGSAFFAFASFVNGLNQRSFDTLTNQLLTAVTSLYLGERATHVARRKKGVTKRYRRYKTLNPGMFYDNVRLEPRRCSFGDF